MISNMISRQVGSACPGLAPVCACRTSDNTLLISPPCNAQHASLASVLGCRALCTTVLVRVPRLQPCSNDRSDPDRPSEDPDRFRNQCAVIISAHNISCDSLSVPELQPYKITVQYFVYAISLCSLLSFQFNSSSFFNLIYDHYIFINQGKPLYVSRANQSQLALRHPLPPPPPLISNLKNPAICFDKYFIFALYKTNETGFVLKRS